jgi:hypothetical protein
MLAAYAIAPQVQHVILGIKTQALKLMPSAQPALISRVRH